MVATTTRGKHSQEKDLPVWQCRICRWQFNRLARLAIQYPQAVEIMLMLEQAHDVQHLYRRSV